MKDNSGQTVKDLEYEVSQLKKEKKEDVKQYKDLEGDYAKLRRMKNSLDSKFKNLTKEHEDVSNQLKNGKDRLAKEKKENIAAKEAWKVNKEKSDSTKNLDHQRKLESIQYELKEKGLEVTTQTNINTSTATQLRDLKKERDDLYKKFTELAFQKEKVAVNVKAFSDKLDLKSEERSNKQKYSKNSLLFAKERRDAHIGRRKKKEQEK